MARSRRQHRDRPVVTGREGSGRGGVWRQHPRHDAVDHRRGRDHHRRGRRFRRCPSDGAGRHPGRDLRPGVVRQQAQRSRAPVGSRLDRSSESVGALRRRDRRRSGPTSRPRGERSIRLAITGAELGHSLPSFLPEHLRHDRSTTSMAHSGSAEPHPTVSRRFSTSERQEGTPATGTRLGAGDHSTSGLRTDPALLRSAASPDCALTVG